MTGGTAWIFAGGPESPPVDATTLIRPGDTVIVADGGAHHCLELEIPPHFLVGDLDSIAPTDLVRCVDHGARIHRFPARKDATDLELAMDLALEQDVAAIAIFGALGGRWDMSMANVLLAAHHKYRRVSVRLLGSRQTLRILHPGSCRLTETMGRTVSLLPIAGPVSGLTLEGFEYPLRERDITFGETLGVSNIVRSVPILIRHRAGILLMISG